MNSAKILNAHAGKVGRGVLTAPWPWAMSWPGALRTARPTIIVAVALLVVLTGHARISVVTLPDRDTVQLTIYNSADLTLVKETRHLTFKKGINKLEFSWANTLIDPTSLELRPLTHADEVEVQDVSFPARVTNTLEWRINSEFAGDVVVEIRYFTSGISWSADYVAEASRDERLMDFSGAVRVTNNSGEDYENAQVRLVVGVIRLVQEIADLARAGKPGMPTTHALRHEAAGPVPAAKAMRAFGAMMEADKLAENRPREIVREGVSEYFMYTVEGRDTIPNGWSKRLPSFKTPAVPITSYYKFEKERWGDRVMRYYQFTNSLANKLGREPLPNGDVKAFRFVSDDSLYAFVGRTSVKYIPINEFVELELGNDLEVSVKPVLMDWQKTELQFNQNGNVIGWTTKETWEIEVQNSKDIPVVLDIRRNFSGDWTLTTQAKYENVDRTKVKFVVPLAPRAKQKFSYELVTRHGTNATR
ncbi:MAG TPA: DUF4139 domain-containing protein [Methylomirabilota bacterium]|nr:DUF4139 domain-containing protein [Methylomirabilota bacterium]